MIATGNRVRVVICGLGGQGNIFLARVLARAALFEDHAVLTAETHGMAQRGAAVESHVKIGDFSSSIVRRGRADAALALDAGRLATARTFLRVGGPCFVNTTEAPAGAHACAAADIAFELGCKRGTNLVLLGFAAATTPEFFPSHDALDSALVRLTPPALLEENRRALQAGAAAR